MVRCVRDTWELKLLKEMINSSINRENDRLQLGCRYLLMTHMSVAGVLPHRYGAFWSSRAFFLISPVLYTDRELSASTAVKIEKQIYYSFDCKSEVEIKV